MPETTTARQTDKAVPATRPPEGLLEAVAASDENLRVWCVENRWALRIDLIFGQMNSEIASGVCLLFWLIHDLSSRFGRPEIQIPIDGKKKSLRGLLGKDAKTISSWLDAGSEWGIFRVDSRRGRAPKLAIDWHPVLIRIRAAVKDVPLFSPKSGPKVPQSLGNFSEVTVESDKEKKERKDLFVYLMNSPPVGSESSPVTGELSQANQERQRELFEDTWRRVDAQGTLLTIEVQDVAKSATSEIKAAIEDAVQRVLNGIRGSRTLQPSGATDAAPQLARGTEFEWQRFRALLRLAKGDHPNEPNPEPIIRRAENWTAALLISELERLKAKAIDGIWPGELAQICRHFLQEHGGTQFPECLYSKKYRAAEQRQRATEAGSQSLSAADQLDALDRQFQSLPDAEVEALAATIGRNEPAQFIRDNLVKHKRIELMRLQLRNRAQGRKQHN